MKRISLLLAAGLLGSLLLSGQQKIVVTGLAVEMIPELETLAPNAKFVAAQRDNVVDKVADADAIVGTFSEEVFRAGKKLKWVHVYSAGVDRYRYPDFLKSDIVLTNSKIVQGPEISDHAFALLLALTRSLNRIIPDRTKEEWSGRQYEFIELRGKTAVIIGVGGIGTQIAQRAHAFGMKVIGVDPKEMPLNTFVSRMVLPDRLDSVLPLADVVFVSAPHTPESEGMMGPREFELMKKNSYFIAVSRGKLYNTEALVKALDERRLAGAGLDVTNPEPLPKGHPLWKFENVIITPHVATRSDGILARRQGLVRKNVERFAKGEPLRNVVDKVKGY